MVDTFQINPKRGQTYDTRDILRTIGKLFENGMVQGVGNQFDILDQTGLDIKIDTGACVLSGVYVELTAQSDTKTLTDNQTNHIWITLTTNAGGRVTGAAITINITGTEPTDPFLKIGEVVTSGGDITGINEVKLAPWPKGDIGKINPCGDADASITFGELKCKGQSLSTTLYKRLFDKIGYRFGGSGGTFNLPNLHNPQAYLRGAPNTGDPGSVVGADSVTLGISQIPSHNHGLTVVTGPPPPTGPHFGPVRGSQYQGTASVNTDSVGGGGSHENKPKSQEVTFTIRA